MTRRVEESSQAQALRGFDPARNRRLIGLAVFVCGLLAVFSTALFELIRYALNSDLCSYIPLVPVISAYLVWLKRDSLKRDFMTSWRPALVFLLIGVTLLWVRWLPGGTGRHLSPENHLTLITASFVCLLISGCLLFCGSKLMRALCFPAGFLFLMVPLPGFVIESVTGFLQHASAETSYALLKLSGTPVFRDGLVFRLPGINIEVAEECSGIRSTIVLLITSLLAGYLFLKSPWRRTVLLLAVVPLGVLRNGFRIFTIGMLCAHVGPEMIDSPLHHRGGPVFFVLSMVPLLLLLVWMRRSERRSATEGARRDKQERGVAELPFDPARTRL